MGLSRPVAEPEHAGSPEEKQRNRGNFERLLLRLSAALADLPSEAVDRNLETWLAELARFVGVDRVTIGEFSQNKPELRATHGYVAPGHPPFPHVVVDDQLPWYSNQIRRGHVVRHERLPEGLPPEAVNEKAYSLRSGLQAHLGIPLKVAGSVLGVLAFGSFRVGHSWSDEMVQRLQLVAGIFASALARKRAEERFRTVVDAAPNGMLLIAADGTISIATTPIERMFGYTREELLGQPVEMLVPERYRVRHVRDRSGFLAAPQPRAMGAGRDLYGRRKDGSEVPLEVGLNPIHTAEGPFVLASIIDISERKRSQEALRKSEARKTAMFETALDCIISIDHQGKIVEFNPAAERTFGYRREEVLAREMAALIIPPLLRERHRQGMAHYLATGEGSVLSRRIEMRAVRADGTQFPVELTVTRIPTDGPPLFTAYLRDITDRKRADAETQALKDQLAHVSRVATMGELAASIAHEVNQPLCAIVSNAQTAQRLLTRNAPDVEELRETLQDIIEDGRRASEVIARIRSFLQKDQFKASSVDVNGLIRDVVALTRRETTKRGTLVTLDLADRLPPVLGDPVQLQQVVLNLMTNALEAMDGVERPLRKLLIRSSNGPGEIAVAVADHGIGFHGADEGRLFEAFFTTKPHGLGMGLAICRSIIQAHGGRLWAAPNTGKGATFHFTLPCVSEGSR